MASMLLVLLNFNYAVILLILIILILILLMIFSSLLPLGGGVHREEVMFYWYVATSKTSESPMPCPWLV
jgi:uncharacterized membrane protein YesL